MASNFPSSLDSYTTKVDNVDAVMAAHINDMQDAVEALEAKVGVNSSAVTATLDYKVRNLPTQDSDAVISNLNADKLDGADRSTDGTLAGNSDTLIPTEKAVKTYSDTKIPLTYLDTDETLSANSDTKVPSQKAIKTYVSDANLTFTDVTTNNASTTKHGYLKKLSNVATEFMNGVGNWVSVTIDSILPSQTGNSGKFLTTNGSVSSWGSVPVAGVTLTSTTSWTNENFEGVVYKNVTIDDTKNYLLVWNVNAGSSAGGNPPNTRLENIRFNSDSGSKYFYNTYNDYAASRVNTTTDTESTDIQINASLNGSGITGHAFLHFTKKLKTEDWKIAYLNGQTDLIQSNSASPFSGMQSWAAFRFRGIFTSGSTAITTINFGFRNGGSESLTGKIWLYELAQ